MLSPPLAVQVYTLYLVPEGTATPEYTIGGIGPADGTGRRDDRDLLWLWGGTGIKPDSVRLAWPPHSLNY
jgi:hypothetical protein